MSNFSRDRRRNVYLEATTLNQTMLDESFRGGENQIECVGVLTKTVGVTTYTLRFADRPKYVGNDFYEGRARFPIVKRTLGELQSPSLQFSQLEVQLANMDGFYNVYLDSGASYFSFIGASLEIKLGLRDVSGSFVTIFEGVIPEEDGFSVSRELLTVRANDSFTNLNKKSPLPYINATDFPSAPEDSIGKIIPMVLGDWEAGYNVTADAAVYQVQESAVTKNVRVDTPNGLYGGTIGYYVGGGNFVFSIGSYTPDTISDVHIKRGNYLLKANFNATPQNTAGYWSVDVTSLVESDNVGAITYVYQNGDVALIKVKVPYAVGDYSNPIELAEQILFTLGDLSSGDLDSTSWTALKTKSTPAQSDFTTLNARLWIADQTDTVLGLVLSLLEQFRVEMFVDANGKLKLSTLHPEDFPDPDDCDRIEQIELDEESVKIKADERTFLNQAYINYAFTPATKKTELTTVQKKNQNSIDKSGKVVAKIIDCPWIYVESDAVYQLIEFVRLYSAGLKYIECTTAWVHILRDLGNFVSFNYSIGSLDYDNKPMQIRDVGIDPSNGSVQFRLLSFANFGYANYAPSNEARFLSSDDQTILDA